MSFDRLKQALQQEAAARVSAITKQQQQRLAAEETRIKRAARELEEHIIRQAENEAEARVRRLHQERQLAAKAQVLTAKQTELAATEAAVIDRIMSWDAKETKSLLQALVSALPDEAGTITAGSEHRDQLEKLLPKQHTLNKTTIPGGGFIYRSTNSELNLTITVLVQQLFRRHQAAIAQQLFS